jgi:hypothetical protein
VKLVATWDLKSFRLDRLLAASCSHRRERDLIKGLTAGDLSPLSLLDRGRDRSRAVRHMV